MFVFTLVFLLLLVSPVGFSFTSSQTTLSSGFYRDSTQQSHMPVYLYWNAAHTSENGIETFIDFGVNNTVVLDAWKFYVYEATLSFPLASGFEDAPYRKSQIQLGRQLYLEGFEIGLLDGVQLPFYWSSSGGGRLLGGGLHTLESRKVDFSSQIYGLTLHETLLGIEAKGGYIFNKKGGESFHLPLASLKKTWEGAPLTPTFFVKGQWEVGNLSHPSFDQGAGELLLQPFSTVLWTNGILYQERNRMLNSDGEFLYGLFATSPQKTFYTSLAWSPFKTFTIETAFKGMRYDSQTKRQSAEQESIFLSWVYEDFSVGFPLSHLHSYGGQVLRGGAEFKKFLNRWTKLRLEADVADIRKLNGISAFAYHGRGGIDFRFSPKILVSALSEVERNHLFEMDARAIVYVSHYLY